MYQKVAILKYFHSNWSEGFSRVLSFKKFKQTRFIKKPNSTNIELRDECWDKKRILSPCQQFSFSNLFSHFTKDEKENSSSSFDNPIITICFLLPQLPCLSISFWSQGKKDGEKEESLSYWIKRSKWHWDGKGVKAQQTCDRRKGKWGRYLLERMWRRSLKNE